MSKYIIKRIIGIFIVMFIVSIFIFMFIHLLPGDPVRMLAGPDATKQDLINLRERLGLNDSLLIQYQKFILNMIHMNLGTSLKTGSSVISELSARYKLTFLLALSSFWYIPFGIFLGAFAAIHKTKLPDTLGMFIAVIGLSIPEFWFGLLLMQWFASQLGWFNSTGFSSWKDLVLPCVALGANSFAFLARFTRSAFLDVLSENYIKTARAKGLMETKVIWKHACKNATLPIITITALQLGSLLGGSIVIENVFALPGLGRLLIDSVNVRDYPVVQVLLLYYSLLFVVINFIVDMIYMLVNPQIRLK